MFASCTVLVNRYRQPLNLAVLALGLALIAAIPFLWKIDLKQAFTSIRFGPVAWGVLCYLLFVLARARRLQRLLSSQRDQHLSVVWLFKVTAVSNLIGQCTIGKIGETTRIGMLKRRLDGWSLKDLTAIFLFEKTSDVAVFGLFSLVAVLLLAIYSASVSSEPYLAIISGVMLMPGSAFYGYFVIRWRPALSRITEVSALTLISNLLLLAIALVSYASVTNAPLVTVYIIHYLSTIVGIVSLLPGGRGAVELTQMSLATGAFGLPAGAVSIAVFQILFAGLFGTILASAAGIVADRLTRVEVR